MVISSENPEFINRRLANTGTLGNYMYSIVLKQINQVLGNLEWAYNININYVDEDEQRSVILMEKAFAIHST